jgi:hypothetical protein
LEYPQEIKLRLAANPSTGTRARFRMFLSKLLCKLFLKLFLKRRAPNGMKKGDLIAK